MEITRVDESNLEAVRFRGELIALLLKYREGLKLDKDLPSFVIADFIHGTIKELNEAFIITRETNDFFRAGQDKIPDDVIEFGGTEST